MVRIIAQISSRAETVDQLGKLLVDLVAPSRKEPGCVSYELFQDEQNTSEFLTIERWTDQAAADAHMSTTHVAEAIARAGNLLARPPLIHRFTQLA